MSGYVEGEGFLCLVVGVIGQRKLVMMHLDFPFQ